MSSGRKEEILLPSFPMKENELVSNRRAFHEYEILETYEAGIILAGTEVKSLRDHGGNLSDAYIRVIGEELWLVGASIAPYRFGNVHNHEEKRDRKLLMHHREIAHLKNQVQIKGLTLMALSLYLKRGKVKVKIGLAKGKKKHDKRQAIMEQEKKREMDRLVKKYNG